MTFWLICWPLFSLMIQVFIECNYPNFVTWNLVELKISSGDLTAETHAILLFCLDKGKKRSGLTTAMWQNWDKYLTLVWPCLMVGSNFLLSACSFTPNKQRTKALVAFHTSSVSTLHTDGLPYKGGPPQRTEEMNSPTISCRIAQIPTLCPSPSCSRRHIFSSFGGCVHSSSN